jgi:hypothetical protein
MLTAEATLATTCVVLVGAALTVWQVRQASKARQVEAALAVLKHIDLPEYRMARRLVYLPNISQRLAEKLSSPLSRDDLNNLFNDLSDRQINFENFHSYMAALEHLSILVMNGLAPDSIVEMYFSRLVPHHWSTLLPLTQYMRSYYHTDDFLQHLEMVNSLITSGNLHPTGLGRIKTRWSKHRILARRRIARRRTRDYDVALVLDFHSEWALIEFSRSIERTTANEIVLNSESALPHLSIYLAAFPVASEQALINTIQNVAERLCPILVRVAGGTITPDGIIMMNCSVPQELKRLHEEVVDATNGERRGSISDLWMNRISQFNPKNIDLLNEIGYPYGRDLWLPHFTVGKIPPSESERVKTLIDNFQIEAKLNFLVLGTVDTEGRLISECARFPLSFGVPIQST